MLLLYVIIYNWFTVGGYNNSCIILAYNLVDPAWNWYEELFQEVHTLDEGYCQHNTGSLYFPQLFPG